MTTRPLNEKYRAFKKPQTQADDNIWAKLDANVSEPEVQMQPIERIRMQPVNEPELNRRDALIRAGAGAVAGVLVANGADKIASIFPDGIKETAPDGNITAASLEKEIMKRKTKGKKNNYKLIMRKYASAKVGRNDKRSRIDFAIEKINASDLPALIKAILPYLPMQESSYMLCDRSSANAVGAWQFIPKTAEKYKLKGSNFDKRCDFKASTEAAIAYFKDILKKIKASKHYKTLESRYAKQTMEDFASLVTINSFNSGEGHMLKAMELLANETTLRTKVNEAALKGGGQGLYVYLTKIYNAKSTGGLYKGKYGKKYQKGMSPKYANVSSRYVFDIIAYKWIHEGAKPSYKEAKNIKPFENAPEKPRKVGTATAGISAGVATVMGYLGIKRAQEGQEYFKDTMTTRREILGLGVATGAAIVGGAAENKLDIAKNVGSININCDGKEKKPTKRFTTKDISDNANAIRKACNCGNISNTELIKPSRYKLAQKLADSSYARFKQTSNVKFMQIARYYYNYCLYLIDEQLKGKMLLPRVGGREKVLERRKYIKQALKIVNS